MTMASSVLLIGQNSSLPVTDQWKTYQEQNFSIRYPPYYDIDTSGHMGMKFVLLASNSSQFDLFRENINLVIQDLSSANIDLDGFVDLSHQQINTMIQDSKIERSERMSDRNQLAFHLMVFSGVQFDYHLKWQQRYIIRGDHAYVMTFTAAIDEYENYLEEAERVMNTLVIHR